MKIIIYGATDIGCLLATEFFEDHDITIIDNEENLTDEFNRLDISFVAGNASNINVLNAADIRNADVFIACTTLDEANIVACLTAKKMSGVKTICFVSKEEYKCTLKFEKDNDFFGDFFIDYIVWPEELLTQDIFRIVTVAHALDVEYFADGQARLLEYKLGAEHSIANKKVKDCGFTDGTLIVGITRNSELFIPNGDTVLLPDDKLIFMGTSLSLDMLAGKNTLVINGDGTNLSLLSEEEIGDCDVAISVTNNDERNLLCSLLCKQLGVKRVIARVSKVLNIPLFEKVGIDIAISPKNSAINEVKNDLAETNVDILATVEQGQGEVLEIVTPEEFDNKKVMELKFPANAIIGVVQRKHSVIIPKGTTVINKGDTLIIFTKAEDADAIKNFFKVNK